MSVTDEPACGRRQRKKQATHRALQRAALQLALEHGPEHMTVEAISEQADVSPRTFFNYFASKEDALIGDGPGIADQLAALLDEAGLPPAGTTLRGLLRQAVHNSMADAVEQREDIRLRKQLVKDNPALLPRHIAAFSEGERALAAQLTAASGSGSEPGTAEYLPAALLAAVATSVLRVAFQSWNGTDSNQLTELVDIAFGRLETTFDPSGRPL